MDQLVNTIYLKTIEMDRAIEEENIEVFDALLNERSTLMARVDALKNTESDFKYSQRALQLLEAIMKLDQQIGEKLVGLMADNKTQIQQFKKNMQVSLGYQPYMKQTSGAFFDKKN